MFKYPRENAQSIADHLEVATPNFVYAIRKAIAAILDGTAPEMGTAVAREVGRRVNGFAGRHRDQLSPETQSRLAKTAEECDEIASSVERREREEVDHRKRIEKLSVIGGVYVYTYPHYDAYKYLDGRDGITDPRTMMKIGWTDEDIQRRINQQKTGMPEAPKLLRVFKPEGAAAGKNLELVEKTLHKHLNAIGHTRSSDAGGGREWFLTNLDTIDSTAQLLKLKTVYAHPEEEQDDP